MEDKNVTKISLSSFLLIPAIVAIIVMGLYIYKINYDKKIETQKSADLQSKVNSLNESVEQLQSKIDSIKETVNDESSSLNQSEVSNTNSKETANNTEKDFTFTEGSYKHNRTVMTLTDARLNIYLDHNFSLTGTYEIVNDEVVCNITEEIFSDNPEDINKQTINDKWSISLSIIDENTLKVKKLDIPFNETEIEIIMSDSFTTGYEFLLQ